MSAIFFGISDRLFHYDRTLARFENFGTGFIGGVDLALAPEGRIYVLNRAWEYRGDGVRVTILTIDEDFVGDFTRFGREDGEVTWPTSIALDSDQNVYVADEWLNRISIFDKEGNFLDKWGVAGSGNGELNRPSGITFDAQDNLYMVDSLNNRVQKFTREGKFQLNWGEPGSGEGQFNLPWGLTVDSKGDVYVADWRNDRIQKFTSHGDFLAEFGVLGSAVGQFNHPTGVAVDKYGDIYVTDWGNDRVQVLTPDGRHITTFTGDAGLSKWGRDKLFPNPDMVKQRNLVRNLGLEKHFWRPKAVEIDEHGRICVLDSYRNRLQVYQKENY